MLYKVSVDQLGEFAAAAIHLHNFCFRKFVTPTGIPDEVQYFSWAPAGNNLVSLNMTPE